MIAVNKMEDIEMKQHDVNVLTAREIGTELGRMFRATNCNGDLDNGETRLSGVAQARLLAICTRPASIATALSTTTPMIRDAIAERVQRSNVDTARFAALLTSANEILNTGLYEDIQDYGAGVMLGYDNAIYEEGAKK